MSRFLDCVEQEEWEDALHFAVECMKNDNPNIDECILSSTTMEHFNERKAMRWFIDKGLAISPENYELYILLGNYYVVENVNLSYLCYENALYYAQKQGAYDDLDTISEILASFKAGNDVNVNNVSFVILSYNNLEYTKICIDSIRQNCLDECIEIVVVDNASTDGSVEWLRRQKDIVLVENKENVGFPGGCNLGIMAAAPQNDIFLLNNDTILTSNALYTLRMNLYMNSNNGAAGAVTNYASNQQEISAKRNSVEEYVEFAKHNNVPSDNSTEIKEMLVMFAMLIKRKIVNEVGLLDERFSPGNFEDDDYGIRITKSGYNNVLCWNSFIYHYGSKSFGTSKDDYIRLVMTNRQKFIQKWGFSASEYKHANEGFIRSLSNKIKAAKILEIGCGFGGTLARLKYLFPDAWIEGIEMREEIAGLANKHLNIRWADINQMEFDSECLYDCIIISNTLEYVRKPKEFLLKICEHLQDDGIIMASIDNLMNAKIIYELLHGRFCYDNVSNEKIHFYTERDIFRLFTDANLRIESEKGIVTPSATIEIDKAFFEKLSAIDDSIEKEQFNIFSYQVMAQKVTHAVNYGED